MRHGDGKIMWCPINHVAENLKNAARDVGYFCDNVSDEQFCTVQTICHRSISKGKDYVLTDCLFDSIQTMMDPAQTEAQNDDNNDYTLASPSMAPIPLPPRK